MAQRQALENEIIVLPDSQFLHFRRTLNRVEPSTAKMVSEKSKEALTRLGLSRDMTKADPAPFDGALNIELASLLRWFEKVQITYKRAVGQLVVLDACAALRAGVK